MSAQLQTRPGNSRPSAPPTEGELAALLQRYLRERGFVTVTVTRQAGELTLCGEVSTAYEHLLARQAVRRLLPDRAVVDCLAVAGDPAKPTLSALSAGLELVAELAGDLANDLRSEEGRRLLTRRLLPVVSVLLVTLLIGWKVATTTQPGFEMVPVSGTVTFDGTIPEGAQLIFHPQGHALPEGSAAVGKVRADGTFQVKLSAEEPGLPPGNYRVTISWYRPPATPDGGLQNCFPPRYAKPDSSPVQVTVDREGPLTLPPIQISRRG